MRHALELPRFGGHLQALDFDEEVSPWREAEEVGA